MGQGVWLLLGMVIWPLSLQAQSGSREEFYKKLAGYHAPVAYQDIGGNPRADAITRFDFDGDWVANNNWDNLTKFRTPAHVYYDVVETKTHYFITYAFFHPRDYQAVCIWKFCHENDFEGAFFTVLKIPGDEFGEAYFVATVAHYHILGMLNPKTTLAPQPDPFDRERRIALRIEAGGHAIYNWDDLPTNDKRLIYHYGGGASDDPNGAQNGTYRYNLLPMSELWSKRQEIGRGKVWYKTFKYGGSRFQIGDVPEAFAGEKFGVGMAHPPWYWDDDMDEQYLKRGDWFFDPAYAVFMRLGQPRSWSHEYIYNPYANIKNATFALAENEPSP